VIDQLTNLCSFPFCVHAPGLICRDVAEHVSLNHAYHLALTTAVIDTNVAAIAALKLEQDALNRRIHAMLQSQTRQRIQERENARYSNSY
jgi:hypothetical protein